MTKSKVQIVDFYNHEYENKINLEIYKIIYFNLKKSLKEFPKYNNLLGVYSVHLLKFLSGIFIKNNEIKNNNFLNEFSNISINEFPFVSFNEIKENNLSLDKNYGLISHNYTKQVLKYYLFLYKKFSNNKISSSLNALSFQNFKKLNNIISVGYLFHQKFFYYEDVKNQFSYFDDIIKEIYDKFDMPFNNKIVLNMFLKHILANVIESPKKHSMNSDMLLITSGNDTYNRHLAANSKKLKKENIIIDHAYYTGYTDDINLGLGEQFYSDYFLSFGDYYKNFKKNYNFSLDFKTHILCSSSKSILNIKKYNIKKSNKIDTIDQFFYIPTSLRGPNYRHGPFMDISDKTYLDWQNNLIQIFDNKLVFKHHPKDKFKKIYSNYNKNINTNYDSISEILKNYKNICFIFDTIGTAFAEVSASNFPIIFFDIHQRNIPEFVKELIKKRCVYVDLFKIKSISFQDIYEQLTNIETDYNALDDFSISKNNIDKDQIETLAEFLL